MWRGVNFYLLCLSTCTEPSAIEPIHNKTTTEGGSITLSCNATGTPHPMMSWIKVGSHMRFTVSDLVFTNINRSEAGEYRCEASNECSNASETATIEVQCKYQLTLTWCFECNQLLKGCFTLTKLSILANLLAVLW